MSETATLDVKVRSELGSRPNKRLRDAGFIPGVIYGHKEAVIPVTLPKRELVRHLDRGTHVFALALDGKAETVLVKDVQYDHFGVEVLHVDFARVDLNEKVEVTIPIVLRGTPKGEAENGVLQQILADLEVECLVTQIPHEIRVSVADLGIGDSIHIKDIKLPDGVRPLQDEDQIVAQVKEVVEEEVATAAAEAGSAEPEVITKGKEAAAAAGAAKEYCGVASG